MHDQYSPNHLHSRLHRRFLNAVKEQLCGITRGQPLMATNTGPLSRKHKKSTVVSNRRIFVNTDFHNQSP